MKVLFVRSFNAGEEPISTRQGESLQKKGINVVFYNVIGKGVGGYLSNLFQLRRFIKMQKPDVIHAHYSFCGILSVMTLVRVPVVVSLMGSDVLTGGRMMLFLLKLFSLLWKGIIVKSDELYNYLGIKEAKVIPNGVDLDTFQPGSKDLAHETLNWQEDGYHILFASDPKRAEKNFSLSAEAIEKLKKKRSQIKIHFLKDLPTKEVVLYYNACDCLLLTSFYEGSPNVIKEAMACNRPVVSTRVGDVEKNLADVHGTFLCSFDATDVMEKLNLALDITSTNGREKLIAMGLDADSTAAKLIEIYNKALGTKYIKN